MVKTLLKDIQLVAEMGCKPRQPDSKTQAPNHLTLLSGKFTWDLPGMWGYTSSCCHSYMTLTLPCRVPCYSGQAWNDLGNLALGLSESRIIPSHVAPTFISQGVRGSWQAR